MDGVKADERYRVGDVVSFGPHWSVPSELVGKYFRVEEVGAHVRLSLPYEDAACTMRYHAVDPITRR